MLRKFRVSNFKSFDKEFELDLTNVKGYEFNRECIKNDLVNTAIIYGYNGCGKSNLAYAIFDIIEHLTDKKRDPRAYRNYLCASSSSDHASFYYEFLIDSKIVKYEYKKSNYINLVYERLTIDNDEVVLFDRSKGDKATIRLAGTESLVDEINNRELSVLKYIKSNALLVDNEVNKAFNDLFSFVDSMLFFRTLEDRFYLGNKAENSHKNLADEIIERGKVKDFEQFLNDANVKCELEVIDNIDGKTLAFKFGDKLIGFFDSISTGTSALTLFYCWYLSIQDNKVSFLIIDEFDAFYHHELSALIVERLKRSGVQCILTSHNISNLTNDLLRPDCYFVMNNRRSKSLSSLTQKELRLAHNIEKMYKAGAFDVE